MSSARAKYSKTSSAASDAGPPLSTIGAIILRTGLATFGSGNTTTALIGRELGRRGWLSSESFDLFFTVARAAPGTNLMAFVSAVGWHLRGWSGTAVALAALSIPASIVVVLLTLGYHAWHEHPAGRHAINAAMAAIVGIMAASSWLIVQPKWRGGIRTATLAIFGLAASAYLSPLVIMAAAAVAGYFWQERE